MIRKGPRSMIVAFHDARALADLLMVTSAWNNFARTLLVLARASQLCSAGAGPSLTTP
jgi:hypothetical protein